MDSDVLFDMERVKPLVMGQCEVIEVDGDIAYLESMAKKLLECTSHTAILECIQEIYSDGFADGTKA